MNDISGSQTTLPPRTEDLPWRRRQAYERAICSFLRPDNPDAVTLADVDRFCRTPQWIKLYAALEASLEPPPGESMAMHVMTLFGIQKEQGTLR